MSSRHWLPFSIRYSPDAFDRRIIALLIVAGEQFEEFKSSVLGADSKDTIYSAIDLARRYLATADYVPESQWPLVIQIIRCYQSQFEKLIRSIGEEKVDDYAGLQSNELFNSRTSMDKYSVQIGDFITTMFPPAIRRPFSKVDAFLIKNSVDLLSEPNLKVIESQAIAKPQATEEPALLSRPQQRFSRPRRISMSPIYETCEKGLFFKTIKVEADFEENNLYDELTNNVAFKDHEVTEFAFCEKINASARERGGLISPKGAFTYFHVDLGGTTNYIYILKGRKIFFMIPPSEENLDKYEKLTDGDIDFFGYHVNKCVRIELQAGDSLIKPSGWIHSVWTPEDSIAFGGSILHTHAISMQLQVQAIEQSALVECTFALRVETIDQRAKESIDFYSCNAIISSWERSMKEAKEEKKHDSIRDKKGITTRSSEHKDCDGSSDEEHVDTLAEFNDDSFINDRIFFHPYAPNTDNGPINIHRLPLTEEPKMLINRVCIIGAGVAGLSAGRVLQKANVPFVIVEGSKRIGGRVFPFEHRLINEVVGDFELFSDFTDVKMEEDDLSQEDKASFTAFVQDLEDKFEKLSERNPSLTVKEAFLKDYEHFIDECPSRSSLRSSFDALARFYLSYYEMEWAANCSKMALANFSTWSDDSENSDESFSLNSIGYKKILDELSASIPTSHIRLGTNVTAINYENQNSVTVHFDDGTEEEFSSVIVTSSMGFLKAHASSFFTPALREEKIRAIEAIGFGDMQKLFLEYANPFWNEEEDSIKTIGLSSSPLLGRGNLFEVVEWDRKVLTLWLSGPAVEYAETRSDEELKEEITVHLRKALENESIEHPTQIMRHSWKKDQLVLGSYSYLTPEAVEIGDANAILAEPIFGDDKRPLICFAGEATHSTFYQTTCGAYLSGEREANRLAEYQK
ncbi:hypothetical protein PRIPAC_71585 [Pristionchus pacificus]|uniref:Dal-1.1 n=1 Tax=Pristionchus pacificus TaxID=54126 RepID=A0A2A6D0T6_PRIPA|nr:hypothetical protein PRIPAC_71585 [Pristionchus pacificus]|eukprot:PDM83893.1 dal-1.1 [Pristionchus pacificus]